MTAAIFLWNADIDIFFDKTSRAYKTTIDMSKLFKKEKIHLSDGWVPSSLVRHILALRHRKYELYAPMKMQTEVGTSIFPVCQGFNLK